MADETYTAEQIRITHRRGHSLPLHERAREDAARADVLVTTNDAMLGIGDMFDGEMLVVDGAQIVSAPIPGGGGGGTVHVGAGITGDGALATPVAVDFGTGTNQVRHGDDAAYTDARTPLAHNQSISTITGLGTGVATALGNAVTGSGSVVLDTSPTLVTPALGTPSALVLTNATGLPASGVSSGTFTLARMTTATANQTLRVDSGGTTIEGRVCYVFVLGSDIALPTNSSQDLTGCSVNLVSGKSYYYRIMWDVTSGGSGASTGLTIGYFSGSATASCHIRVGYKVGLSNAVTGTRGGNNTNLTSGVNVGFGTGENNVNCFFCMDGTIICNGTGTLVPAITAAAAGASLKSGTSFFIVEA